MNKSFVLAALHALLVTAVWLNYAWENRTLPRAWTRTTPVDPYDPLRGRFVRLGLLARIDNPGESHTGKLYIDNGQLFIQPADCCESFFKLQGESRGYVRLSHPASFFIPEDIPDPSQLKPGEELWAEVSVPPRGTPRPVRLAIKHKDGSWQDLTLRAK